MKEKEKAVMSRVHDAIRKERAEELGKGNVVSNDMKADLVLGMIGLAGLIIGVWKDNFGCLVFGYVPLMILWGRTLTR